MFYHKVRLNFNRNVFMCDNCLRLVEVHGTSACIHVCTSLFETYCQMFEYLKRGFSSRTFHVLYEID